MRHDFGYFEEEQLGKIIELGLWQRIMSYVAPYWKGIVCAIILSFAITGISLAQPYVIKTAIDQYIVNSSLAETVRFVRLGHLSLFFLGLIASGFVMNFLQVILLEWMGQHIMHRMRQHLFSHLLAMDLSFFNKTPVGKLTTRLTNDIQNMHEMFTSVIVTVFNDFVRIIGILVVLYFMNKRLALVMTLLIPLMIVNTVWFSRLARKVFRQIRTQLARINSFLQEAISGVSIIQLFETEKQTVGRFKQLNQEYYASTMRQIAIFGVFMPFIEFASTLAVALIIWYGGGQIIKGNMTLGILVAFLSYMRLFFQPLRELSQKYSIVQSALASAERIFQLLDTRPQLVSSTHPVAPRVFNGKICYEEVSFSYQEDQPVLQDINICIRPGETLAIVGSTGSGKTTLVNLLERFYDPDRGKVTIDGIDLREIDTAVLRTNIGLVMQDIFIVPDTIRKNITLDKQLSDVELHKILAESQLDQFINSLPGAENTVIGEGGLELSAGQKQLLSFARVLVRDPSIIILDEATSNIDSETEELLEQVIDRTKAGRTNIIIAHRLSTIKRADRILVMEHGAIVQEGSHEELMSQEGLYRRLQELQFQNNNR